MIYTIADYLLILCTIIAALTIIAGLAIIPFMTSEHISETRNTVDNVLEN